MGLSMNTEAPPDRSHLLTEQRNPRSMNLHELSVAQCVGLIHDIDRDVLAAMEAGRPALTAFIEAAEPRFLAGGRLIYIGAGTSGRLGVLDASEAPPTFHVEPGRIIGIIAGGDSSLRRSSEGKEDDPRGAIPELDALRLSPTDTLLGIAAGGTTPYVLGAIDHAKRLSDVGCWVSDKAKPETFPLTALVACSPVPKPASADHLIILPTGPEVLTGSTRMKAGTATKLALNAISTTLMVRSGRVFENLMVDVRPTNAKLLDRAVRIVSVLTGLSRDASATLLESAGNEIKTAVLVNRAGLAPQQARQVLNQAGGRLGKALQLVVQARIPS
jgi:N-acetylmuramic acid 6-phosphate etherase